MKTTTPMKLDFPFKSNYPNYQAGQVTLLPTATRINALTDYTGQGVEMAFVDSGFSNHADLTGRIKRHIDASTRHIIEQDRIHDTTGLSWHGQMTSVIAAGDGRTSNGHFRGIVPEVDLTLIKVSTPDYRIKERDILRGLQWIYDSHHRHNIRVVNVSVGGDNYSNDSNHFLHRIVHKLYEIGIVVVVAAGNSGRDFLVPPASAPEALTIGGYDDQNTLNNDDWVLYHHSYGTVYNGSQKPDLIAPANWIASPLLPDSPTETEIGYLAQMLNVQSEDELLPILKEAKDVLNLTDIETKQVTFQLFSDLQERIYHHKVIDGKHQHVDGTSVAAPITAAVIAQMIQANPKLTPQQVYNILTATAKRRDNFEDHRQGAGLLDAPAAVLAAKDLA